jgi:hypothetical protein
MLNFPISPPFSQYIYGPLPPNVPTLPHLPTASPSRPPPSLAPVPSRLLIILDATTRYFFPDDPDDELVREREKRTGVELDTTVPPMVLLLRKCCVEDLEGGITAAVRDCLLPADM